MSLQENMNRLKLAPLLRPSIQWQCQHPWTMRVSPMESKDVGGESKAESVVYYGSDDGFPADFKVTYKMKTKTFYI